MAFNTNAFWGSSDADTFRCQTPPALLNTPPDWDGFLDFKESIDSKGSLELLQEPLPCPYEPHDEWLVEFKRLQDVHNRAPVIGAPATAPTRHERDAFRNSNIGPCQLGVVYPCSSQQTQHHPRDRFPRIAGPRHVPDETSRVTPTQSWRPRVADGGSPVHYECNPTPGYDTLPAPGGRDIQMAVKGLREFEENLQAETKRRISQIEQSRPG